MIDVRHLRLISTVAEVGTLKNAADKLFLTQSALSHQLRELEQYLGTPVFYRLNKQLVLTPSGKVLLDASKEILEKLKATETTIKQINEGIRGNLRIMVECYTAYHWLPKVMKELSQEFPKVDFSITFESNHYPIDQLVKGELDIALLCDYEENPLIKFEKIFDDEIRAVVPANHPLATKSYLEAEDFENIHLLIHSFPLDSVRVIKQLLIPEKINLRKVTQIPITDATIEMVKNNIGITTLPHWLLAPYEQNQDVVGVPITREGIKICWFAAMLKEADRPAYFDAFIEKLLALERPCLENRLYEKFS